MSKEQQKITPAVISSSEFTEQMTKKQKSGYSLEESIEQGNFDRAYDDALNVENYSGNENQIVGMMQQSVSEVIASKINKLQQESIKIIDTRPHFLKPAYFLPSLASYMALRLKLTGGLEESQIVNIVPPSNVGEFLSDKGYNEKNTYSSVIKSFIYKVLSQEVEIVLSDVNEDLIEMLAYSFGAILQTTPPIIEIEYGWSYSKDIMNTDDVLSVRSNDDTSSQLIYFRRSIYCKLEEVIPEYSSNGEISITLKCHKEQTLPEPFRDFLPYDFFGSTPGVTLQMIHIVYIFLLYSMMFDKDIIDILIQKGPDYDKSAELNKKPKIESQKIKDGMNKNLVYVNDFIEFLFLYKGIKNEYYIVDIFRKMLACFRPDINFGGLTDDNIFINSIKNNIKVLKEKEKYSPGNMLPKAEKNVLKNVTEMINTYKNGGVVQESEKLDKMGENSKAVFKWFFNKNIRLVEIHENLRDYLKISSLGDVKDHHRKRFYDMIISLQPAISECKIHPYDIFLFVCDGFEYYFKKTKERAVRDSSLTDEKKKAIVTSKFITIDSFSIEQIGGYKQKTDTITEYYDYKVENYLINANSVYINPATSWDGLFKTISDYIYIWVTEETWQQINHIKDDGKEQELKKVKEKYKEEIAGNADLKNRAPVKMTCNMSTMNRKEAYQSLVLFKQLLNARAKILKFDKYPPLQTIEDAINNIKNSDNLFIVLYKDIYLGSNIIFDEFLGKNNILQAYSYRGGGNLLSYSTNKMNTYQFNPGYPDVWSINFPDVLSFTPKFNFSNEAMNLAIIMKDSVSGAQKGLDETRIKIKDKEKELQKLKASKTEKDKSKVDQLQQELNDLNSAEKNFKNQISMFETYHGRIPYSRTPMVITDEGIFTGSDYGNVQNRRKTMQEYRLHLMQSLTSIEVDLSVLGDPIMDINCIGKNIFLKVLTNSGKLSFFTGVYNLSDITHEISGGNYKTIYKIMRNPSAGNKNYTNQLYQCVNRSDDVIK